jgi:alpha-L-rhamnosidase
MNSFNHWALGSVGEWVWRDIVGINPLDDHPGYEQFVVRPRPGPGFTWAQGQYDSIRGRIVSDWQTDGGHVTLRLRVPPGATARVYLPSGDPTATTEGGQPVGQVPDVKVLETGGTEVGYHVASGSYEFVTPWTAP